MNATSRRVACLLAIGISGCAGTDKRVATQSPSTEVFHEATITYRVDHGQLSEPTALARIEGQSVSYDETPSPLATDLATTCLTVRYPHPFAREGHALAQVIVASRPEKKGLLPGGESHRSFWKRATDGPEHISPDIEVARMQGVYEAWALDVPRAEVDEIVFHLNRGGFFGSAEHSADAVTLLTAIDGTVVRKRWSEVPALDALVDRIRKEGKLVAYSRPQDSMTTTPELPTSDQVYAELAEADDAAGVLQDSTSPIPTARLPSPPAGHYR